MIRSSEVRPPLVMRPLCLHHGGKIAKRHMMMTYLLIVAVARDRKELGDV